MLTGAVLFLFIVFVTLERLWLPATAASTDGRKQWCLHCWVIRTAAAETKKQRGLLLITRHYPLMAPPSFPARALFRLLIFAAVSINPLIISRAKYTPMCNNIRCAANKNSTFAGTAGA